MTNRAKLALLRKALLRLPVSEREAVLRRAKLRSVERQDGTSDEKHQRIQQHILCKLYEPNYVEKTPTGEFLRHEDCATAPVVKPKGKNVISSPINNFPACASYDGGVPDAVTLEVFALRRRNAELQAKVEGLNNKLTRVLECFQSLRRFFRLWIYEGQGESHDTIIGRMKRIDAMIELIDDRMVGAAPLVEIPERWRKS